MPVQRSHPRAAFHVAACLAVSFAAAPGPAGAGGPTFTRVTDPANPVIAETFDSAGSAWADLDGDGFLDLFVPNGITASQPNSLFLRGSAGAFVRVRTGAVVADGGTSNGGVFGDYDRDGFPDLFVCNRNSVGNFLYRGQGDSSFAKVTTGAVVTDLANSNSASWVDVDVDGDLDLFVVNFQGDDFLYVNGGAPGYALARTLVPSLTPGAEFSIHGTWADFDDDGDSDLFVGLAGNQNDFLYVNEGGLVFTRRVLADARSTLGASWGDFDNDGDLDLFAAMFLGQPSLLWRNEGAPGHALTPVAASVYPADASQSIGSVWGDVDNDGDLDLFVSNDGPSNMLYLNAGPPTYALGRVLTGALVNDGGNSFGCSLADVDRDGALDVFVANRLGQPNFLYMNDGPVGHWLAMRCTGTTSNPSGIGARVRLRATIDGTTRWQTQEVLALTGYDSQNLELHFGLGDATVVDTAIVRWTSGHRDTLVAIPADRLLQVVEGQPLLDAPAPTPGGGGLALRVAGAQPFRGSVALGFALPEAGHATLQVVDVRGRRVASLVSGPMAAGSHRVTFVAPRNLTPGVYWAQLTFGDRREAVRLVHLR